MQNLTRAYFRIVKKNVIDGVPKAIMYRTPHDHPLLLHTAIQGYHRQ